MIIRILIAAFVLLMCVMAYSLVKAASRADRDLEEMHGRKENGA